MALTQAELDAYRERGYTHVPLMREILADFDTPLSTYCKLAHQPYTYLLESVQGGEKWGRYSIIGLPCSTRVELVGNEFRIMRDDAVAERWESADPFADIQDFIDRYSAAEVPGMPKFTGGLVGYFGYDAVRYVEPVLGACPNPDTIGSPDVCLLVSEEVVVFDNLSGRLFVIVNVETRRSDALREGNRRLDELVEKLSRPGKFRPALSLGERAGGSTFESAFGEEEFQRAVGRAREYILAGDVFQVVLSQRLSARYEGDSIDLYRALRTLNPSPYMFYLNMDSYCIVGSSPEVLVRCEDGLVTVRPLAGTRARGKDETEDRALAEELLADEKERAEHVMLVDLGRNDVGRVSELGSVRVSEVMEIERYSHVMHIVSNVTGVLRDSLNAIDVLRATLPAGTVSGAPKVRAMQIIDELEPQKRGIYAGAVGYISWGGNLDTAIAIRTAVLAGERIFVQAGAGIVADSDPRSEWQETMDKARALLRAVTMAEQALGERVEQ